MAENFLPLSISRASEASKRFLGGVCALAMALLTLSVLWGVATRYLFGTQAAFTEELARMLLIVITFLGGAYAFGRGAHIGLDFLSERFESSAHKLCAKIS